MGQTLFHGHPHEHPMGHLEGFEDLVFVIKANRVLEDYLPCKLFKYSFVEDVSHWLNQSPPGSLTSYTYIKNEFLRNFFDDARAEDLRSMIASFTQKLT